MAKLFAAFGQTESGETAGGTGLGLVISRTYARLMGGDLTASSAPERGTVFSFIISVDEGNEEQSQTKVSSLRVIGLLPGPQKNKVLIVDDLEINRRLLASFLDATGFESRQAANGLEAVEIFRQWAPDIVLMDMSMPIMDGFEAIRRIRSTPAGVDAVIIAVTASAFADEKDKTKECGADDHLGKPFKEADLFELIRVHAGVEYRYEEQEAVDGAEAPMDLDTLKKQISAGISTERLGQLRDATISADLDTLNAILDEVAKTAPDLALKLREIAASYEYDLLLALFSAEAR
jgi:CheY-like chemotaxis protein